MRCAGWQGSARQQPAPRQTLSAVRTMIFSNELGQTCVYSPRAVPADAARPFATLDVDGGPITLVRTRCAGQCFPAAFARMCSTLTCPGFQVVPGIERSGANGSAAHCQATARLASIDAVASG